MKRSILAGIAVTFLMLNAQCSSSPTGKWRAEDIFESADVVALAKAAADGDLEEIDRLIEQGVDPNAKGKQGLTPLIWVLWSKNEGGFKRLLDHGANPNAQMEGGRSVTSLSAGIPDSKWLEWTLDHGGDPNLVDAQDFPAKNTTPLFDAILTRNPENIALLIKAGADLDHQNSWGETPMLHAATLNWYDSVYQLLEAGADFRIKDHHGHSLAFHAFDSGDLLPKGTEWREKVLSFLQDKGVDIEAERENWQKARQQ